MAFNFPNNPSINDSYQFGGVVYEWDGSSWTVKAAGITGVTTGTRLENLIDSLDARVDSIDANGIGGGLDSAQVLAITLDSASVQGIIDSNSLGGLDSAQVQSIIDSNALGGLDSAAVQGIVDSAAPNISILDSASTITSDLTSLKFLGNLDVRDSGGTTIVDIFDSIGSGGSSGNDNLSTTFRVTEASRTTNQSISSSTYTKAAWELDSKNDFSLSQSDLDSGHIIPGETGLFLISGTMHLSISPGDVLATRVRLLESDGSTEIREYQRSLITGASDIFPYSATVHISDPAQMIVVEGYTEATTAEIRSLSRMSLTKIETVRASLPVAFKGFRAVRDTTAQSLPSSSNTTLVMNSEEFDTEDGYNPATGIFTVPASLDGKYMVFSMGTKFAALEDAQVYILEATVGGLAYETSDNTLGIGCTTGPILVSAGEEYRPSALLGGTGDLSADNRSFFAGYVVETSEDAFDYITDSSTAITLTAADFKGNRTLKTTNDSDVAMTLNTGLSPNGPLTVIQGGLGAVTVSGTAAINSKDSATTSNGKLSAFTLIPTDITDEYDMIGDLI